MANISELCKNIPSELVEREDSLKMEAAMKELMRRKNLCYLNRIASLKSEEDVFFHCQQRRPSKRKVQNKASNEEMGTIGRITRRVRTGNYTGVVCKSRNMYL